MDRLRPIALAILLLAALVTGSPLVAQQSAQGVLVLDQERLFNESAFGVEVAQIADQAGRALQAENRRIEQELTAEELALTEQRPGLSAAEFKVLADRFDTRVQDIRAAQDAKSEAIATRIESDRRRFFQAILPVLAGILRDEGAALIVDKRTALLSISSVDITDQALSEIDAALAASGVTATAAEPP
ncbi:MAG: OmpH family outer membrane protein [Pseudomonadota bacterium]